MGKNLKSVPEGNKGLGKLSTEVRNKMGFMKKGGEVKGYNGGGEAKKSGSMASRRKGREYTKFDEFKEVAKRTGQVLKMPYDISTKGLATTFKNLQKTIDTPIPKVGSRKITGKEVKNYSKGGAVTGGTSSQTSGKRNSGIY